MATVTIVKRHRPRHPSGERTREEFIITGHAESQEWIDHLRPPDAAWCSISLWDEQHIGSFGGSVWPMAWPSLFRVIGPRGRQTHELTAAGQRAFAAARASEA